MSSKKSAFSKNFKMPAGAVSNLFLVPMRKNKNGFVANLLRETNLTKNNVEFNAKREPGHIIIRVLGRPEKKGKTTMRHERTNYDNIMKRLVGAARRRSLKPVRNIIGTRNRVRVLSGAKNNSAEHRVFQNKVLMGRLFSNMLGQKYRPGITAQNLNKASGQLLKQMKHSNNTKLGRYRGTYF
jgi:hypothetical protein